MIGNVKILSIANHSIIVIPLGFEPKTHSLEGCCSIQLSYETENAVQYYEKMLKPIGCEICPVVGLRLFNKSVCFLLC